MKLAGVVRKFGDAESFLIVSKNNALATCVLNNPKGFNALNLPMIDGLNELIKEWNRSDDVGAVLIYGHGGKAFCAGGDIRALYDAKVAGGDT
jgi:enoyl-CoA hydratase/carnithine racemase